MSDPQEAPAKRRGRPPGSKNRDPVERRATLDKARAKSAQNRLERKALGLPPAIRPGSKAAFSRDVGLGLVISLNCGLQKWPEGVQAPEGVAPNAIEFWLMLKRKYPVKYAECLMKLVKPMEGDGDKVTNFIVQQLVIQGGPVAGVLTSPIGSHVAPPLRLVGNGEPAQVVDMESGDG